MSMTFTVRVTDELWSSVQKIPGHDLLHTNSVALAFGDGFISLRTQHRLACLDLWTWKRDGRGGG